MNGCRHTCVHAHTCAHACVHGRTHETPHSRTHAQARMHTYVRTHARTRASHMHVHICVTCAWHTLRYRSAFARPSASSWVRLAVSTDLMHRTDTSRPLQPSWADGASAVLYLLPPPWLLADRRVAASEVCLHKRLYTCLYTCLHMFVHMFACLSSLQMSVHVYTHVCTLACTHCLKGAWLRTLLDALPDTPRGLPLVLVVRLFFRHMLPRTVGAD